MNKSIDKIIQYINVKKKKIIKGTAILGVLIIGFGVASAMALYGIVKSNINYTEEQAIEMPLSIVSGE